MIRIAKEAFGKMWDPRYDLPLFPEFNNPWIYGAYALKLWGPSPSLKKDFTTYAFYCEKEPGYFTRWPDGSGGETSHDELMGIAYTCGPEISQRILKRLEERGGRYNPNDKDIDTMYRFIFLVPFLRLRATYGAGLIDQIKWSAHVFWSAIKYSGSSGPLKIWITEEMTGYPLCRAVYAFWESRMKKAGPVPEWMLKEHFPNYPEVINLLEARLYE